MSFVNILWVQDAGSKVDEADQTQPFVLEEEPKPKKSRWTDEEITTLKALLPVHGRDFDKIGDAMSTRTASQIKTFYSNYRIKKHNLATLVPEQPKTPKPRKTQAPAKTPVKVGVSDAKASEKRKAHNVTEKSETLSKRSKGAKSADASLSFVEHMPLLMCPNDFSSLRSIALQDPRGDLLVFDITNGAQAMRDFGGATSASSSRPGKKKKGTAE